jgi:hypothetical protein
MKMLARDRRKQTHSNTLNPTIQESLRRISRWTTDANSNEERMRVANRKWIAGRKR